MRAKYIVKSRSWTVPTRIFDRGGWRDTFRYTPRKTLETFHSYTDAEKFRDAIPRVGFVSVTIFFRGKPYRKERNYLGEVIGEVFGDKAVR